MSTAEDSRLSSSGIVPIFPLPNAVLFPHTVLPLHVFEPRYREMVRDASSGEGLIAIALLQRGYEEDYEGSPEIHRIGTVGRIEDLRPLADGRYNLNLVGLQRVALDELSTPKPYRLARVTPLPEPDVDEHSEEIERSKRRLLACHGYLMREISGDEAGGFVMDDRLTLSPAVNGACANLPLAAEVRQQLLEIDSLAERQERAIELVDRVLERVLTMKSGSDDPPANDALLN